MQYPEFYDRIEGIDLYDSLAEALGAFENGRVHFSYLDVVKSAGHSCPTIAGAYLMVREGLKALYGDEIPSRGNIKVFFKEAQAEGTTGVIANVFSLITGATDVWGFKGINGAYNRTGLMAYHAEIACAVRMQRLDTMQCVDITYNPNIIETEASLSTLMQKFFQHTLSTSEKVTFQMLWQQRVAKILENFDKVIIIK